MCPPFYASTIHPFHVPGIVRVDTRTAATSNKGRINGLAINSQWLGRDHVAQHAALNFIHLVANIRP